LDTLLVEHSLNVCVLNQVAHCKLFLHSNSMRVVTLVACHNQKQHCKYNKKISPSCDDLLLTIYYVSTTLMRIEKTISTYNSKPKFMDSNFVKKFFIYIEVHKVFDATTIL